MKRNFVKISLSVVVLILALAFCLTGCDDATKAEIETIKENVTATQTKVDEVISSLDAAKTDLDNKIAANTTKIDTEVAALNTAIANAQAALEAADAANKTALEKAIADAKAELQAAIDKVAADLEAAKTDLGNKITANTTKIDTEVANLNTAIANAQAALEAADTANKTALEKAIADAKAELKAAIDKVAADLEAAKTDLGNKIAANTTKIETEVTALNTAIANAQAALEAADTANKTALEKAIADAKAELKAAIDKVAADLEAAKTDLGNKIAANTTKIDTEVVNLSDAIKAAQAVLETADVANKTALEKAIADAKAELNAAIDKVAGDLAQVVKDLAAAKEELTGKITANDTKIDTEVGKLNTAIANAKAALEKADSDNKALLEVAIATAEETLQKAIDKVAADLAAAKKELSDKIAANTTKIDTEVTALNTAIANAQAALEAADTANKTALEKAIADAKAELQAAIDKVAGDLAQVVKDLAAAKEELAGKITANDTKIDTEVGKLNTAIENAKAALEKADSDNKALLEAAIATAEETLQKAIDKVATDLAAAKKELSGKIATNTTKIETEVTALNTAIANAQAALEAADAANKTALENAIEAASTDLDSALKAAKAELLEKIAALETYAKDEDIKLRDEIDDVREALEKSAAADVLDLLDKIDAANVAIDANTKWIAEYKATTEKVVEAVFGVEKVWTLCNTYCVGWGEIAADELLYVKEQAKVYLYRATNEDDIKAAVERFYTAIDEMDTPELSRLKAIHALLEEAKANIDAGKLTDAVENLAEARVLFVEIGMDNCTDDVYDVLIIDGKAVDLSDIYSEYRLTIISLLIDGAETALEGMDTVTADTYLGNARTLIDEVIADAMTTELEGVDLVERYNEVRVALINAYLAKAEEAITDGDISVATDYLEEARDVIDAYRDDTEIVVDVDAIVERYNTIRFSVVDCYLNLADEAINNAEDKAVVDNTDDVAWQYTVKAEVFTATISADGVDVTELTAEIAAVRDRFYAKYVDLYAVELTGSMNNYVGHLDAIYGDIGVNNMDAIKAEFTALRDHEIYSNYFVASASDVVRTLVETADKLDDAIDVRTTLISLNMQGDNVAAIIEGYTVEGIVGTKSESELLIDYKNAYEIFIDNLDEMYAAFEDNEANKTVYNTIEARANKTDFDALKAAFDAKIYPLTDYGQKFIDSVEALKAYTADGFKFNTGEKISAAKDALKAWLAQSADVDSVAFVIEYCSDGTWTHSQLVKVIYDIEGAYNAWLKQAAADWAAAYTNTGVGTLTVNNITIYETKLEAVRAWFDTYPLGATEDIYGTEDTYLWLTTLEARLTTLKSKVAAEAERVQGLIDLLKGDDTLTANRPEVVAARAAYNAWVAGTYSAGVNEEQIAITSGSAFDTVDIINLLASEAKLAELDAKISEIKGDIADLEVPTFDDMTKNYFADLDARNVYAATVAEIADKIEAFKAVNGDDLTVFTAEELKKVEDCKLYAEKYDSLVKLNSAYTDITGTVSDPVTLGKLASYYNDAIAKMKDIHSESVFKDAEGNVVTNTTPSIQIAIIGNNAEADLSAIAGTIA